jgi:hypothetical protein
MILGTTYLAHRIVYSLVHRVRLKADVEVDHIDLNGLNNSPDNLRLVSANYNSYNKRIQKSNTTGYKGVCWHTGWKAFYGRVIYHGVRYRTDPCPTAEQAAALLRELREHLHGEFCNHG